MSAYTWSKQELFLDRNKLMQKQEGVLCQVRLSQDAGCSVCGLEGNIKDTHCHHTPRAPSLCATLPPSTQARDNWHKAEVCHSTGGHQSRIHIVSCTHTVPFPRWSCLQKQKPLFCWLLCNLEGNVMLTMACNLTGGPQPCAKYHEPCQPSSWSAVPSSSFAR